jgi:hypothetical protein
MSALVFFILKSANFADQNVQRLTKDLSAAIAGRKSASSVRRFASVAVCRLKAI